MGFGDEVRALALNSEAFPGVYSAAAVLAKHVFQPLPKEVKWDREKIR